MYRGHRVAVVVPAYNEAGLVGDVIDAVPLSVDRVYVVDDASTDETWAEITERARARNRRLRVDGGGAEPRSRVVPIRHEENRGVGAAIKTGYRRAREDDMDVAAVLAGDGQMDPDLLPRFLDPVVAGRADYAKGNRLLDRDSLAGMSRWRLFGNVLLTVLTKAASGYWKTGDPQNGYTVVALDAFDDVALGDLYDDYGFSNDILVAFNIADKRVADVPMPAKYGAEESTIAYGPFVRRVSGLLARGFARRLSLKYLVRDFHPLAFLYAAGVGFCALGVAWAFAVVAAGALALATGTVVFALGVVCVLLAAVLDMAANEGLESVAEPHADS